MPPVAARVEWVRYGEPAARALAAAIAAAKADEPLHAVTVVVPANQVGVATRRRLGRDGLGARTGRGGIAAVNFLTVYRLAEYLGAPRLAASGRRPVSTPVIAAAFRRALREDAGIFAPVAEHPATEAALVASYKELRDLSEESLDRLAQQSERSDDVVRLHRVARRFLADEFSDEEDLVLAAQGVLASDGTVASSLGDVIVYLPQDLSRHGCALLAEFARRSDLLVLAGTTNDARADAGVLRSVSRIAGSDASPRYDEVSGALRGLVSEQRTRVVITSDADEEARAAVRAVIDAAREGIPLERVAILYGSRQPYVRLVHEHLDAAGITHNGQAVVPLTSRVAGRTLIGLLELPATGLRRTDVLAWMSGAPLRCDGAPIPVAEWERLSREAGVVAGRAQWDSLLEAAAAGFDAKAVEKEADADSQPEQVSRLQQKAERARAMRHFILRLADDLETAGAADRPWDEQAEWARQHLCSLLGELRARATWPLVEQKAFERTERALARLARLAAVEGPVSLQVFSRTLRVELETDLGRVGRMGEGVLTGAVSMGLGLDLDLAVVVGLAEGAFPAPVREDSLLPDDERRHSDGELPLRSELVERQHRELLAVLAGAARQVLVVPRGDLRGSTDRIPSRYVAEVGSLLSGQQTRADFLWHAEGPWVEHVGSFDAGIKQTAFPATAQEYRLRTLLSQPRRDNLYEVTDGLHDEVFESGVRLLAGRRSSHFTRFDGNLTDLALPSPVVHVMSATRLESWARCPFAYFGRQLLGIEPVENPEDELVITPARRGSLVHAVLERFLLSVLARPDGPPAPKEPWSKEDHCLLGEIAEEVFAEFEAEGFVGRPLFWMRDRRGIRADLDAFLLADDARRAETGGTPRAAEFSFGSDPKGVSTVAIALSDGRSVEFRGKADRLDITESGRLEVVDYKTGSTRDYQALSADEPDGRGRRLQLVVYALAARRYVGIPDAPVAARYWFITRKASFQTKGYEVTEEVLERVGRTIETMVEGIEGGVFPNYTTVASTTPWVDCAYCDPDALGVGDVRRQLERKRSDPALAAFLRLAEGGEEPEDEGESGSEGD